MKIVQVAESFGGGVYSFLVDLCNELSKEHEVIIIYSFRKETPNNFKDDFNSNIKFIQIEMGLKNSIKSIYELIKIINKENPDIYHLHSSKAGFVGRVAARLAGYKGKAFYNPHGLSFLRLDLNITVRKVLFLLEKYLSKLGGTVIGVSESEKNEISKYTDNVTCINNGIDIDKIEKEIEKINGCNNDNNNIIVGTVGRIEYQKNPKLFNKIAKNFPQLSFLWIGDGSLKDHLKSENIKVTGWLTRLNVLEELSKIDIYIQTSLWEGLPISVLEAMYLGKPILANKVIGNIDLVDQSNGFLFTNVEQVIDNIQYLLKNKDKILKYGSGSKEKVLSNYKLSNTIRKYESIYNR